MHVGWLLFLKHPVAESVARPRFPRSRMKDRVKSILRRSGLSSPSLNQEQIQSGSRVQPHIRSQLSIRTRFLHEATSAREATLVLAWKALADRLCPGVYTDPYPCHAAAYFRALL